MLLLSARDQTTYVALHARRDAGSRQACSSHAASHRTMFPAAVDAANLNAGLLRPV